VIRAAAVCAALAAAWVMLAGAASALADDPWAVAPAPGDESAPRDTSLTITNEKGEREQIYTHSYAVIIAQGDYRGGAFDAVRDQAATAVMRLRPILERQGFHVVVWRDLNAKNLKAVIDDIFDRYGWQPQARLFFYYFGHGYVTHPDDGPGLRRAWLVPIDPPDPVRDEERFQRASLSMKELVAKAGDATLKHAFYAIEACDSGNMIDDLVPLSGPQPPRRRPHDRLGYLLSPGAQAKVSQFLTAGDREHPILADNVFTNLLASGLTDPSAVTNDEGYITGTTLIEYVKHRLAQNPDHPYGGKSGTLPQAGGGDMIIGQVARPAKPAPAPPPVVPAADAAVFELTYWNSLDKTDPGQLQAYLDTYGEHGRFANLAHAMLKKLRTPPNADARSLPSSTPAPVLAAGARPGVFAAFRDCADCLDMVALPGGTFTMGSPKDEPGRDDDEDQVSVTLPGFAISRFPVTRGQYAAFAAATGRAAEGACYTDRAKKGTWASDPEGTWRDPALAQEDSHPVVCVNWDDAAAYAAWMKEKTGQDYRLLTEAEYEYANRAGTKTAYFWGTDANAGCAYANLADATAKRAFPSWDTVTCDDGYERTSPVGHFAANPWGLFDITGDVWSWTADCYANSYASNSKDGHPYTPAKCDLRVFRGGSWYSNPRVARAAYRGYYTPSGRLNRFGFRLARTLSPATP
jgi:formylglycine-generating enzyme required for sulfatase activity